MNLVKNLMQLNLAKPAKITVMGDVMTDRYVSGHFEQGQDDCPKFVEERCLEVPGGAGNALRSLAGWGGYFIGDDSERGSIKTRYLVNGKIVFRHDSDVLTLADNADEVAYRELLRAKPDGVLLSDYDKGNLSPELIRKVIGYAKDRGIPCVVDAKREPSIYKGAVIKGNLDYARRYGECAGMEPSMVLTQGSFDPCLMGRKHAARIRMTLPRVECKNHVGAGDCFAAHLTLALAHGFSLEDAATVAHSAGRVYVQHPFNRPPYPHEIARDMDPVDGKILDAHSLPALQKSMTGAMVWANGCFDLFGPHHLHLLREASKLGSVLVVGINDDEGVHRLKGVSRPVMPLEQRARLIASLECVAWVVPFSGDAPVKELEILQPDVRVRADLPGANTAGDEHVKSVRLIEPLAGWSTTGTVKRIMRMPYVAPLG